MNMWNAALRRVVRDEEEREREKRVAAQLRLKREALLAATATASSAVSGASVSPGAAPEGVLSIPTEDNAVVVAGALGPAPAAATAAQESHEDDDEDDEEEEEEEDYIQRHLLSLPKSKWSCLEDSQQAFCLAMNRTKTVFAVGERDGRISVWDNVSIRVITRELDPTLLVLPEAPEAIGIAGELTTTATTVEAGDKAADSQELELKKSSRVAAAAVRGAGDVAPEDEQEEEKADDSATNDDGSVEADDDMDEEEEEDENDEEDVASVEAEERDAMNTEEDDMEDDLDDDENDNQEETDEASSASTLKKKRSTSHAIRTSSAQLLESGDASGASTTKQHSTGLSFEDLRVVKTSLKVVTHCAWSCDTRRLFAGCEEKGNRRGRLCVWDVEAASIFATFSFDAAINCVSAHPEDPDVVLVSYFNSLPVLLNVRMCTSTRLDVPLANPTINTTVPANSRHPSLIVSAMFGTSGAWIYCATSKSTLAIFETATLACLDSVTLPVLIQFIDLAIDYRETALLLTSAKGIHEFAIRKPSYDNVEIDGDNDEQQQQKPRWLSETRAYATGAVRAPWALCCFSDDESFVVGMPVVRHRHVGENGLYTWNRATGRVQHNPGVKDGVNSLAWDTRRDSILAVSTTGALFVLEEEFKTTWSGPMYPAGYRLITDNELHIAAMDAELETIARAKREPIALTAGNEEVIDVFTIEEPRLGPSSAQKAPMAHLQIRLEPLVADELVYIPSVPIAHHHKKHHHAFQGHSYNEEKHFGLGQSIFEPLKVPAKAKSSNSRPKKKASSAKENGDGENADGTAVAAATITKTAAPKKKRARSSIGSQKRRRR